MTIIWTGIALGSLYAIAAVLYNLTVATAGIFNFAAAQYVMVGVFVAFVIQGELDLPLILAVPAGAAIGGLIGWLTEVAAVRPLEDKTGWAPLVTTVGASVVIEGVIYAIWGADPRNVDSILPSDSLTIFGGRLQATDLALIVTAVVLCTAAHVVHSRTRWGLMGRAMTNAPDTAAIRGINTKRLVTGSFVLAGSLGGASGVLIAPKTGAVFSLGATLVVFAFAALTVGGFGSYVGCLVGGLIVGLIQVHTERYLGSSYPLLIIFGTLLVVLLIRPTGLFGDRRIRLV
ncbi:MAG: branched-chain amino acid ABC transporter permease [Aeromicrobium sp.]